jgi:hypothetical protein
MERKHLVRFTLDELKEMVAEFERCERSSYLGVIDVNLITRPNGNQELELEQPSAYAECFGKYHRYALSPWKLSTDRE